MVGYKHSQMKSKTYDKIQKLFDKEMEKKEILFEAEMKRHIEIVKDDEVSIDSIPLATKPPSELLNTIIKNMEDGIDFIIDNADEKPKRKMVHECLNAIPWVMAILFNETLKIQKKDTSLRDNCWIKRLQIFLEFLLAQFTTAGRINVVKDEIKDISEKR
ncbi:hypothetical protein Tco_0863603 [Tanacetum coccineum]